MIAKDSVIPKEEAWEAYTSTWSAPTDEARLATFAECLREDCVYTDPNVEAAGYERINDYMNGFQQQVPGGGFVTRSFQTHHDYALVEWDMVDGAGETIGTGSSFGVFDADGRLAAMTGFFPPMGA